MMTAGSIESLWAAVKLNCLYFLICCLSAFILSLRLYNISLFLLLNKSVVLKFSNNMNFKHFTCTKTGSTATTSGSNKPKFKCLGLTKPIIVGYMSADGDRSYHSDLSQLKFLNTIPSEVSLDLNHNISMAVKRTTDDNDEKITLLLRFLLDQYFHLKHLIHKSSFITYRRTLISIMCNAYGSHESLKIVSTYFNGSIYLCSVMSEEEIKRTQSRSKDEEKFCAWGYKFEQYLLSDCPNAPPDIHKPVIENEEFSIYYNATLGNKQLLYGAQIDGLLAANYRVDSIPETADVHINLEYLRSNLFLELKTNRHIQHYKQERNFKRYKLLRCWCQCYLADLKGLLVGYRTDDGIIQHLQWFDTPEIASYCKDVWNAQTAIDYLDYVLSYIQSSFQHVNSSDLTTLQFEICSNGRILISNVDKHYILPNWYVEAIKTELYLGVFI